MHRTDELKTAKPRNIPGSAVIVDKNKKVNRIKSMAYQKGVGSRLILPRLHQSAGVYYLMADCGVLGKRSDEVDGLASVNGLRAVTWPPKTSVSRKPDKAGSNPASRPPLFSWSPSPVRPFLQKLLSSTDGRGQYFDWR